MIMSIYIFADKHAQEGKWQVHGEMKFFRLILWYYH